MNFSILFFHASKLNMILKWLDQWQNTEKMEEWSTEKLSGVMVLPYWTKNSQKITEYVALLPSTARSKRQKRIKRKETYKSVENAHGIHYGRCGPSELATLATKDGKPQWSEDKKEVKWIILLLCKALQATCKPEVIQYGYNTSSYLLSSVIQNFALSHDARSVMS